VLVQVGLTEAQKGMEFLRDQLAHVGIGLDVVPMDFGSVMQRWQQGDYDAIYHHLVPTDTDPASNLDWWLSRGSMHMWHPAQKSAATPWEAEIDAIMAGRPPRSTRTSAGVSSPRCRRFSWRTTR
jgi:peptide/nickel transport system substrate-binding protein